MNKQILMNAIKEIVKEEVGKLTTFSDFGYGYSSSSSIKDWLKENELPESLSEVVIGIDNEIYIKLDRLGSKHYIDESKDKQLVEFLKLAVELGIASKN